MSRISKTAAETISQIVENKTLFDSTTKGFKNIVKKHTVIGFLALCSSISCGLASAQDYTLPPAQSFQLDIGGFLNNLISSNSSPTNQLRMSDVPQPCNVSSNYLDYKSVINASVVDTANASLKMERDRLSCASNVYATHNVSAPKYKANSSIDKTYILYEIRDYTGRYVQVTYGNSPSIQSMQSNSGELSVESNKILKQQMDIRAKNLILAHEDLNRNSRDYINLAYGTDTPEYYRTRFDSNRQQAIYMQQRILDQSFDNYAKARTDFVSLADSATVNKYNISEYSATLNFISAPESTSQSFKSRPPNKYSSVSPGAFKF